MLPFFDKSKIDLRVADLLNTLRSIAILDGALLTDVALSTSATNVNHGLGRQPIGYIVVGQNAAASIFETKSARTNATFQLTSSASVTADIWVF